MAWNTEMCIRDRDNGYYFFKYCMEQLPKEKKQHIYYILDTDSADYDKMKQYGDVYKRQVRLQFVVFM